MTALRSELALDCAGVRKEPQRHSANTGFQKSVEAANATSVRQWQNVAEIFTMMDVDKSGDIDRHEPFTQPPLAYAAATRCTNCALLLRVVFATGTS